ncbi:MAG: hypothetical protein MSH24_06245 [Lachnospiraceae bacterium]|nr:hypothetical protein [Lachnospiraceae bacterium]
MDKVLLKVYDKEKYSKDSKKVAEVRYTITGYEVKKIPADVIEQIFGDDSVDECGEYLILHFKSGETSTFRNSHVDMFHL